MATKVSGLDKRPKQDRCDLTESLRRPRCGATVAQPEFTSSSRIQVRVVEEALGQLWLSLAARSPPKELKEREVASMLGRRVGERMGEWVAAQLPAGLRYASSLQLGVPLRHWQT